MVHSKWISLFSWKHFLIERICENGTATRRVFSQLENTCMRLKHLTCNVPTFFNVSIIILKISSRVKDRNDPFYPLIFIVYNLPFPTPFFSSLIFCTLFLGAGWAGSSSKFQQSWSCSGVSTDRNSCWSFWGTTGKFFCWQCIRRCTSGFRR